MPIVGCYAHKLNLAVKKWLGLGYSSVTSLANTNRSVDQQEREFLIEIIKKVCVKVRTDINIASYREVRVLDDEKFLKTLIDQETRWSSIYYMVKRFRLVYDSLVKLADLNLEIKELMPSQVDVNKIYILLDALSDFNSVTKTLQSQSLSLDLAADLFSSLVTNYGNCFNDYLNPTADIILNPNFDNGLIKVLNNDESNLNVAEKNSIEMFKKCEINSVIIVATDNNNNSNVFYAENVITKSKLRKIENKSLYNKSLIEIIPSTSCDVERLFNRAKVVMPPNRSSMTAYVFEMRLCLLENISIWKNKYEDDIKTKHVIDNKGWMLMQKIVSNNSNDDFLYDNKIDSHFEDGY